jgi:hypothetical protein
LLDQQEVSAANGWAQLGLVGMTKRWGKLARSGLWGPDAPAVPVHEVSTARAGGLNLLMAPSGTGLRDAPIIGQDASAVWFQWDPWRAYTAGLVSSQGIVLFGLMGMGKSMCAKTIAGRLMAAPWNRKVVVLSDPKGEWVPVADWCSGQVVSVGPGSGNVINPLDSPSPPYGIPDSGWVDQVQSSRLDRLRAIVSILRGGKPFTEREEVGLGRALGQAVSQTTAQPTLGMVFEQLDQPSNELVGLVGLETCEVLALTLRRVVEGSLGGMFNGQTSFSMHASAPLTVFDSSALFAADKVTKAIVNECVTGWLIGVLRSGDGEYRLLIAEEGWEAFSDEHRVAGMDEILRMSGQWRCALMLIFHEMSDADQFGGQGSAHRARLSGVLSKAETQIVYKCSTREAARVGELLNLRDNEREMITVLPQGVGLWRLGQQFSAVVHPQVTEQAYKVYNTDRGRVG